MTAKKIVIVGLIALAVIGCGILPVNVLRIDAVREKKTVHVRLIEPSERVTIGFIHSVEHCPVQDSFTIDRACRLVLRETTFASSNNGLPYRCSKDEIFINDGKQFRIDNRNIIFPLIDLWVDRKYDNTIQFGDQECLPLPSLAGNTLLRVSTAEVMAVHYLVLMTESLFI